MFHMFRKQSINDKRDQIDRFNHAIMSKVKFANLMINFN